MHEHSDIAGGGGGGGVGGNVSNFRFQETPSSEQIQLQRRKLSAISNLTLKTPMITIKRNIET